MHRAKDGPDRLGVSFIRACDFCARGLPVRSGLAFRGVGRSPDPNDWSERQRGRAASGGSGGIRRSPFQIAARQESSFGIADRSEFLQAVPAASGRISYGHIDNRRIFIDIAAERNIYANPGSLHGRREGATPYVRVLQAT